ncbi:MAG: NADH-quinone oxidoreductase subunit N [Desulfotalea sp.]
MIPFLPELAILFTGLIFFVLCLKDISPEKLHGSAILASAIIFIFSGYAQFQEASLFYGAYEITFFSQIIKMILCGAAILVLLTGNSFKNIQHKYRGEYYLFFFMSLLGLVILASSVELITIVVALELSSFTTYLMVAMRSGKGLHNESAIKYLLFGVMATGLMLFGMSYIFGLTGSTHLAIIAQRLPALMATPVATISMTMLMAGIFYKLALFPIHAWAPDAYQGAADETTSFIATLPKLGAIVVLIRFSQLVGNDNQTLVSICSVCAIASMFLGNFSALIQKDIKRLLAFSGIAHGGFILLGVLLFDLIGYRNALYYTIGYILMNLACFHVITIISKDNKNLSIEDFAGLHKRSPLLAITLATGLFALAGIPPFMGFTGKFTLLVSALEAGYTTVVILAAINTAIALYYYLNIVRLCYCTDDNEEAINMTLPQKLTSVFLIVTIIYLGVFPEKLFTLLEISLKSM